MRKTTTGFEQRWSLWLSALSGITLIISGGLAVWIQSGASGFSALPEKARESLLSHYNDIAHGGFIAVLVVLAALLIRCILKTSAAEQVRGALLRLQAVPESGRSLPGQ